MTTTTTTEKLEDFLNCLAMLKEPDCYSPLEVSRMLSRKASNHTIRSALFHWEHCDVADLFRSVLDMTMEADWRCDPDFPTTLHVLQSLAHLTSPYELLESGLTSNGGRSNQFLPLTKLEFSTDMVFNAKRLLEGETNALCVLCRIARVAITMAETDRERRDCVCEKVGEVCLWLFYSWTTPESGLLPLVARSVFEGSPVLCLFSSIMYHLSHFPKSIGFLFALEIHRRLSNTPDEKKLVPRTLAMCLRCPPSGRSPDFMKDGTTTECVRALVDRKLNAPLEECVVRKMEASSEQWREQIRFVVKYVEQVHARLLSQRNFDLFDDLIHEFLRLTMLIRTLHLHVTMMNSTIDATDHHVNDGNPPPKGRTKQDNAILYSGVPISLRPLLYDLEALLSIYFIDNEHILTLITFATNVLDDGFRNLLLEDVKSEVQQIAQKKQNRVHVADRNGHVRNNSNSQKCQVWTIRSGRSVYVFTRFLLGVFSKYLSFCSIKPPQKSSATQQITKKLDRHGRREKEAIGYRLIVRTVIGLLGLSPGQTEFAHGTEEENRALLATARKDMLLWMEKLFPSEEGMGGMWDDKEVQQWMGCIALDAILDALDAKHQDKSIRIPAGELLDAVESNVGDALMVLSKQIVACVTRLDVQRVQQATHLLLTETANEKTKPKDCSRPRPKTAGENRRNQTLQTRNPDIDSSTQSLLLSLEDFSARLVQSRQDSSNPQYKDLLDLLSCSILDLQQRERSQQQLLRNEPISHILKASSSSTLMPSNCTSSRKNTVPGSARSVSLPLLLPFRSAQPPISKPVLPIISIPKTGETSLTSGIRPKSSVKLPIPEHCDPSPQEISAIPQTPNHHRLTPLPPSTKRTLRTHQRHIVRTDVVLQKYLPPLVANGESGCSCEKEERDSSLEGTGETEALDDLRRTELKRCNNNNNGTEISV